MMVGLRSAISLPKVRWFRWTDTQRASVGWEMKRLPWISVFIIALMVFAAALAPVISPQSPRAQVLQDKLMPPMWQEGGRSQYVLGTDVLGRDVLSRLIHGARVSLMVAVASLVAGGGLGLVLGLVAGFLGGRLDTVVMRAVDACLAFPTILFALLLAVTMGPGLVTVTLAITILLWAPFARVIRGEVLSLKVQDYVSLARVHGCSAFRIILQHITPNVLNTFFVMCSLNVGLVILTEATLSFLGAGIPPPTPSWGQMVADGRAHVATAWWVSIIPGVAITLVVIAFNLFGDWLRDRLDPRLRNRL